MFQEIPAGSFLHPRLPGLIPNSSRLEHDWFDCNLPKNIHIGERSWLHSSYAFIHYQRQCAPAVYIGHDSGVYVDTYFDLGPEGSVHIGNFCSLVGVIICSNRRVVIEDYVFIAHEVVIADSFAAVPGRHQKAEAGESSSQEPAVFIGEGAWIGTSVTLLAGSYIVRGAIVGAGAVVHSRVPDYSVVAGNPSRVLKSA